MKISIPLNVFPVMNFNDVYEWLWSKKDGRLQINLIATNLIKEYDLNDYPVFLRDHFVLALHGFLNATFQELKVQDVFAGEWIIESGYGENSRAHHLVDNSHQHRFMITKTKTVQEAIDYMKKHYDYPLPEWNPEQNIIFHL